MTTMLAVGSSIFEAYREMPRMLPDCMVRNRAVGGTTSQYWVDHLAEVLLADPSDVVLLYCGSNDINAGVPAEDIVANVLRCCAMVHKLLPDAAFGYFSIIKAPQKRDKWNLIEDVNAAIRARLPPNDLYLETNVVFCPEGFPLSQYYVEDGLHLTHEAYAALSVYARPLVSGWLKGNRISQFGTRIL